MLDIVYPYIDPNSHFDELRYSLRSVEKHLQENARIWIVGELPEYLNPEKVRHIPHTRNATIHYTNCYDAVSKLELVLKHPEVGETFVLMYDDIYFLKPVQAEDMLPKYAMNRLADNNGPRTGATNTWTFLMMQTLKAIARHQGIENPYNCETHLPRFYSKGMMQAVFDVYQPKANRYLTGSLYSNHFEPELQVLCKEDGVKGGFYGEETPCSFATTKQNILDVVKRKQFLNHNDAGLDLLLQTAIEFLFPERSRWEVETID